MNTIYDFKVNPNNKSISKNFKTAILSDRENLVIIELEDFNILKEKEFKKYVVNSNAVKFIEATGKFISQIGINPGDNIEKIDANMGSMAFQAKTNSDGAIGFVSSGHVFYSNADVYRNNTYVGTVDKSTFGGNIDASFILLHDYPNNYTTNLIGGVNNLSTLTSLPGVGTTINIRGAYTQASGKILDTNVIIENEDGTTLYNLTSATYPAIKGDSGGIIYSYVSASNTRYTVGVHVGLKNSVTYYCKANNVLSALGLSRY